MRSDDRLRRDLQSIVKRFVGNVRNIDDHADGVHLAYHLFSEIRKTVVFWLVGRRIAPISVAKMRECHGEDAHAAVHAQHG